MAEVKAKPGNSGASDPDAIRKFFERVERIEVNIAEEKSAAAEAVKKMRDDIKHIIQEAGVAGINEKSFKAVLKERALLKKHMLLLNKLVAPLDIDQRAKADAMRHAMGMQLDLPFQDANLKAAA